MSSVLFSFIYKPGFYKYINLMYLLKTVWENYDFRVNSCLCNPLHMNCSLSHINDAPLKQVLNKNQPTQTAKTKFYCVYAHIHLLLKSVKIRKRLTPWSQNISPDYQRTPKIPLDYQIWPSGEKKAHLLIPGNMDTAWMATAMAI